MGKYICFVIYYWDRYLSYTLIILSVVSQKTILVLVIYKNDVIISKCLVINNFQLYHELIKQIDYRRTFMNV
jgi:hypothetical protein